jgi:beta-lactamase superfamily II metal-dependent hydrolase
MLGLFEKDEKLYNEEEILVTLESYNKKENTLLLDFIDEKHYLRFNGILEANEFVGVSDKGASMLYIINFQDNKRFKEGAYYNIDKEAIKTMADQIAIEEDSAVIRYRINLKGKEVKSLFSISRINKEYLNIINKVADTNNDFLINGSVINNTIKLIVRNVGQGSWNEFVINDKPEIIFDIGTTYHAKKNEVKRLMSLRDKDYQQSKPIIILSHWDVDHYHMLLEAEDDTIKSITQFIYRATIPNKTSKGLIKRFNKLNPQALIPIIEKSAAPKRSSDDLEFYKQIKSAFSIYNGSENANRNKGGMLLIYSSATFAVVCGADFHYSQINDFVLPNLNYSHAHYLIVPHHGGEAGKVVYKIKNAQFQDAIISVGKNNYGHPFQTVKDDLTLLKFKPIDFRVRQSGLDYELTLK